MSYDFRLHTLKGTAEASAVDLFRLSTLKAGFH